METQTNSPGTDITTQSKSKTALPAYHIQQHISSIMVFRTVSDLKTLVTSDQYIQVVKPQSYLDYFLNIYSKTKTNIRL